MERTLKDLCAKHGLSYVSVSLNQQATSGGLSIFLHWDGTCAHGVGDTFDAALDMAVVDMAERRTARAA